VIGGWLSWKLETIDNEQRKQFTNVLVPKASAFPSGVEWKKKKWKKLSQFYATYRYHFIEL